MRLRLLDFLCCPECKGAFRLIQFATDGSEIIEGVLHCEDDHFFPIVGGIPRMLSDSFHVYWQVISAASPRPLPPPLEKHIGKLGLSRPTAKHDSRTKANFSSEWDNHEIGGRTWTMELSDRVQWFFLDPIKLLPEDLVGKTMLDAGCGNGSQSVAYTRLGLEVIALDISTGLEKGYAFRTGYEGAKAENVHFIQADLQNPPLRPDSFDILHSAGVLHHTPNTERTFRALHPLLKDGGTFYVWVYKYEDFITPIVNVIRALTTRMPTPAFAKLAEVMAVPFVGFCWLVNRLGLRRYAKISRREAVLALHDIFGAPYAHYHSYDEVVGWFRSVGISSVWPVNADRRGFGVCGRAEQGSALVEEAVAKG